MKKQQLKNKIKKFMKKHKTHTTDPSQLLGMDKAIGMGWPLDCLIIAIFLAISFSLLGAFTYMFQKIEKNVNINCVYLANNSFLRLQLLSRQSC
jgi:hypothetical protein